MVVKRTSCYTIAESSHVGEVRRAAARLAATIGLSEEDAARSAILASELASNLVQHAHGPRMILMQPIAAEKGEGLEIISVDCQPGIANMSEAQRDGFSTAGSAGQGIGAMRRVADLFDIYSVPGRGTVVLTRLYPRKGSGKDESVGAIVVPKTGETESGDACAWELASDHCAFMVADGLGHGPIAAEASAAAVTGFTRSQGAPATERLAAIHEALRGTRGAAVAIAHIDRTASHLEYVGLGNIAGVVVGERARSLVSLHGTAGQDTPRITSFPADWSRSSTLIMHSDGINSRWDAATYAGLTSKHPSIIAAVIYRDAVRGGRDDASILVYNEHE